ncbi:MAG: class IV adenylate cyclase [Planctomycetota bacterium]
MRANLEIKARGGDWERARAVATERVGIDEQVDTYFVTRMGRLKLRESSMSGGFLIPYLRPDIQGARRSDYQVIPIEDPDGLRELLSLQLGVHRVVKKRREILLYENVRIHLDVVEGLGEFVEFEAVFDGTAEQEAIQQDKVKFLMKELGIADADLIAGSYEGMTA